MSDGSKKEPTAAEAMLFFSIVKNTKNKADVDWEAVATEQGFKNAEVAKVRFGQVKRKLGIASESGTTPVKSSGKRSISGAAAGPTTPSKVAKITRPKKGRGKVKKEEPQEYDESKPAVMPVKAEQVQSDAEDPNDQLQAEMNAMVDNF